MEQVAGLMVLVTLTALTACVATVPYGATAGPQTTGRFATVPDPTPIVAVDQPIQRPGPPISRERSLVLDTAFQANSNAAIIMFLLNNPGDRFAPMARTNLNARQTPDTPQALQAAAGANADMVAAFDAARLSRSDAAWNAFLARYGDSPLAAEVANFR